MSVFTSKVNAATGNIQWLMQDENYDYNQEIARSAYADMLHDTERNKKYEAGLIAAIKSFKGQGRPCNVLDIGTGTGLLSMMAVRNGADQVFACDAFHPAADCAEKIITANGMAGKIKIIRKRSTELTVPADLPARANILVTEVFDTELIGEGAISTFRHALHHLLEPDCIVIPSAARMYIQPVQSEYLSRRNELSINLPDSVKPVKMPSDVERYNNGLAAPLFDLQLSELPQDLFTVLSAPVVVFRFDFCGREELLLDEETDTLLVADKDGVCDAFFMWWDLDMDMNGDIQLSCAPFWQHPAARPDMQWRDHWMQAVFYPSTSLTFSKGHKYLLQSVHDEYSLSFDVTPSSPTQCVRKEKGSTHLLHCVYTRPRLAMLSDSSYTCCYLKALESVVNQSTVALCVSDCSFLPFLLARLGAKKVHVIESEFIGAKSITQSVISHNGLDNQISICEHADNVYTSELNLVVGEPYFSLTVLPWDDLRFWYVRSKVIPEVKVCPVSAELVVMAVQFDDLHKIRQPVGVCEGLDLAIYDRMIEGARQKTDNLLEPQPLWEYPCKALSSANHILQFDFLQKIGEGQSLSLAGTGRVPIQCDGDWNGVAVWMVYKLDEKGTRVSFGVEGDITVGEYPKWNMERKQGVYLPHYSVNVIEGKNYIDYEVKYDITEGDLQLSFTVS